MKYNGYKISRTPEGDYRVTMPNGETFSEVAANVKTAKKWVDAHRIEVRTRRALRELRSARIAADLRESRNNETERP